MRTAASRSPIVHFLQADGWDAVLAGNSFEALALGPPGPGFLVGSQGLDVPPRLGCASGGQPFVMDASRQSSYPCPGQVLLTYGGGHFGCYRVRLQPRQM